MLRLASAIVLAGITAAQEHVGPIDGDVYGKVREASGAWGRFTRAGRCLRPTGNA